MKPLEATDKKVDAIALDQAVISIKNWYLYLLPRWRIITVAVVVGMLIGFLYAWQKPTTYLADCTFVLEDDGSGMMGQYAGLASMVGINLGGMSGGSGIFEGDNIIELYKSRSMIKKTLLTEGDFKGKKQLLIERYADFNNVLDNWKNITPEDLNFRKEKFTFKQDSILRVVVKDINKNYLNVSKPDKKLSIISVRVESKDQLFAKNFTDRIVENVNRFYVNTRTKKSLESVAIFKRQADSVRRVLDRSITGTAAYGGANPNANMALHLLKVPSQKLQVDIRANAAIYEELVKNLEMTRVSLRRETPLIQIVDTAELPLEERRIGKLTGLVAGAVLAGLLCVMILVSREIFKNT